MNSFHIIVSGKVQNVGFRYAARKFALEIGLTGFVRNQPDKTVEMEITGNEDQIVEMEKWCFQGPPAARIDSVKVTKIPLQVFPDFSIRY